MHLFIHIPKTAGTSLRDHFSRRLKDRIAYDYGPNSELTHAVIRDPDLSRTEKRSELEKLGIECLCGHVRYEDWSRAFAPADVITVLRHPVDRCISHYQHYLSHGGDPDDRLGDKVAAGELSLRQFAEMPRQRNLQTRYLAIRRENLERLSEFGALLISESLDSTTGLQARLNTGQRSFRVTANDVAAIVAANPLDMLVYELVRQAAREGYWQWTLPDALRPPIVRSWLDWSRLPSWHR